MRDLLILAILLVTLNGCVGLAKLTAVPSHVQAGSYDCTLADDGGTRHLIAAVAPDRNGRDLDLKLGLLPQLVLSPLASASGQLYSGPTYAWRAGNGMSVLTDVRTIEIYNCRPFGGR